MGVHDHRFVERAQHTKRNLQRLDTTYVVETTVYNGKDYLRFVQCSDSCLEICIIYRERHFIHSSLISQSFSTLLVSATLSCAFFTVNELHLCVWYIMSDQ